MASAPFPEIVPPEQAVSITVVKTPKLINTDAFHTSQDDENCTNDNECASEYDQHEDVLRQLQNVKLTQQEQHFLLHLAVKQPKSERMIAADAMMMDNATKMV